MTNAFRASENACLRSDGGRSCACWPRLNNDKNAEEPPLTRFMTRKALRVQARRPHIERPLWPRRRSSRSIRSPSRTPTRRRVFDWIFVALAHKRVGRYSWFFITFSFDVSSSLFVFFLYTRDRQVFFFHRGLTCTINSFGPFKRACILYLYLRRCYIRARDAVSNSVFRWKTRESGRHSDKSCSYNNVIIVILICWHLANIF